MASIEMSSIRKSFGETPVLKDVSLSIADGEFVTLVGPSGCGKSTLLRILAGLESPDRGTVKIGNMSAIGVRPAERNLAMVFQSYALYPHLTVRQNLATPLRLRDLSWAQQLPLIGHLLASADLSQITAKVQATAATLKIERLLDRKPGQLSGGQRQRVALGRAMVRDPAAFLMDEPLSNLDAALRVHMRAELSELHRALGATFVYVTHDQAEALTMSDRMAVMHDGRIMQVGPPDAVYDDPDTLEVARFIGSPAINLLPGEIGSDGTLRVFETVIERFHTREMTSVTVGIRPEAFSIVPPKPNCLSGTVGHRENLGSEIFLHVDLDGGTHRVVVKASARHRYETRIGHPVSLDVEPSSALLFQSDGARLRLAVSQRQAEIA